jgi:NitT/TauT family transport system substrate-binding protein
MKTESSPARTHRGSSLTKLTILLVLLFLVGFIVWLYRGSGTKVAQSLPDKVVISQAAKVLLYLPLYIANEQGFFREENIDAVVVTAGGDSQAFAAVVGGSADFGQGDPMMVALSRQRGGPGKIIGNVVGRVAFWGVATDSKINKIERPQDFKGKRVVTYPEPNTIYALQKRNLQLGGIEFEPGLIVPAQFGSELIPLFSGKAEIAMTLEPVVSQAVNQGAHVVYSFPEQYGDFILTGIMVTEETIQKRPGVVQRVLNAYQRALTYAHNNPDGAIATAKKEFPEVDGAIIADAVRRMLSEETIPKSVKIEKAAYEKALLLRRDVGDLEKDVRFEDAVDNRFAEAAERELRKE